MNSQKYIVLEHLRKKKPVTAFYGYESLGVVNLSGRISELRQEGYEIESVWQEAPNRFGDVRKFVRYVLKSEPSLPGQKHA